MRNIKKKNVGLNWEFSPCLSIANYLLWNSALYDYTWFSYIQNFIIILSQVYNEPIQQPAPSWLVSLIGRALDLYPRGQGFESRTNLNFFRLSFRNCKSRVHNGDDHPSFNSSLTSSHIWFLIYSKLHHHPFTGL